MPRRPRIEYPGAFYHVMSRGNNGEYVLTDEEKPEYVRFIEKYKERYRFKIYAYCIMDNHVHFLLETGEMPLSKIMQGIQQSFTQYYNKKHGRTGHVFQQRYNAELCDKEKYLWQLIKYIHYNPVKAGFKNGLDYKWSSHKNYVTGTSDSLVDVRFVLNMLSDNPPAAQKQYRDFMNIEPGISSIEEYQVVLEDQNESKQSVLESRKTKFEVILNGVCKEAKVSLADILRRTKIQKYSDVRKAIVRLSAQYSDITSKELAERLNITPSMVSKIISGESRGTYFVDELIQKAEEKGIIQA